MAETPEQLLIRFRGICALVDLDGGKKRTLLLRHRNDDSSGIEHHIPYIEFFADDVLRFPRELKIRQYTRPGFDGRLARVDLEDFTEITLKDIGPGVVHEEANYRYDVPHMKAILNDFDNRRDLFPSLLEKDVKKVDRERIIAVFDMPAGRIAAGEPESMITRFDKRVNFTPRRLARWTDLLIDSKTPITLQLKSVTSDTKREIVFRDTLRMLTIGNEPERIILGILTSDTAVHAVNHSEAHDPNAAPVQPTGHYKLYYDLMKNPPADPPVPIPTQYTTPGCPPNGYP